MELEKRICHLRLNELVLGILNKAGADNEQGRIFASALIWSDLIGRPTHGVWRLPAYVRRLREGLIKCPCVPVFHVDNQAISVMDGDQGIGHYVGHEAMMHAIGKAEKFGIAAVGVHNSNHFGTGAYYVQLAAQQKMIGFAFSNSIAKVAPYGGAKALFGTNPFAFGAPGRDGNNLLFDMATSAISGSQAMKHAEAGELLPEGVAIDAEGRSIRNPDEIGTGALLPFGGAKGSGLAMMVEILSTALAGAVFSRDVNSMFNNFTASGKNGHFFMVINPGSFIQQDEFMERLETLFELLRGSAAQGGKVSIPGESRWASYHQNMDKGIPLDSLTFKALEELASSYQVSELFEDCCATP